MLSDRQTDCRLRLMHPCESTITLFKTPINISRQQALCLLARDIQVLSDVAGHAHGYRAGSCVMSLGHDPCGIATARDIQAASVSAAKPNDIFACRSMAGVQTRALRLAHSHAPRSRTIERLLS